MRALTILALLFAALPARAGTPLRRVHVVLICDSNCGPTPNVNACARAGARLMYELVTRKVPASRRTLTFLSGEEVTPRSILTTIQGLTVRRDEALFVYSISHGSYVEGTGHLFNFSGGRIPRAQLMRALRAKGAALTVLYTECCSNYPPGHNRDVPDPSRDLSRPSRRGGNLLADLLLCDRGVVDITAARPGQLASARRDCGGNLTGALFLTATRLEKEDLDADRDGRVTWREAWPTVYHLVGRLYKSAPCRGQSAQQPISYGLGAGRKIASPGVTRRGENRN